MTVFKNSYFLMRHGQSKANVADKVVSDPNIGCHQYGLSPLGEEQAVASALAVKDAGISVIVCSDFTRTRETAALVAKTLSIDTPIQDIRLRERFFGTWEGKSSDAYEQVWARDAVSSSQTDNGVESTEQVRKRTMDAILALENQFSDQVILLVSHGDALQILTTAFSDIPAGQHRTLPHHETGDIKPLAAKGEALPSAFSAAGVA
ncbi:MULTISPECIES: histidine phosphatase family protein [Enterovibrio]|uniref:histidine phosphatase family protein n=1 Tax=Enterovibrio TaxID=188143 RepID=UPI0024B14B80|nr:histidine phosphatase family protein [Enterovibrio norvegicus]